MATIHRSAVNSVSLFSCLPLILWTIRYMLSLADPNVKQCTGLYRVGQLSGIHRLTSDFDTPKPITLAGIPLGVSYHVLTNMIEGKKFYLYVPALIRLLTQKVYFVIFFIIFFGSVGDFIFYLHEYSLDKIM